MKRAVALIAMSVGVLGSRVAAQTSVADGVIALSNGDYQRAVEILRPVTETLQPPDRIAAFFMGMLYESGRGLPQNPIRACAHYLRAGEPMEGSPFWQSAMFLSAPSTLLPNNPDAMNDCQRLATDGFDADFPAQTFQLAADHSVEWNGRGATVWYRGTSKFFPFEFHPLWGGRFLPLQNTALDTGPSRTERRDFIELAFWQHASGWRLRWLLYEVVRGDLVQVGADEIATASGSERPEAVSDELRQYVRLDVNADGDAVWSRTRGSDQRAQVIDTEADRDVDRAERDRSQAREAARAMASGQAGAELHDTNRAPALVYADGDVEGCGMIQMASWSADRAEAILVRSLNNAPLPGTFDLASSQAIQVQIYVYSQPVGDRFCTAAPSPSNTEERVWRATSGTVVVEFAPQAPHRKQRVARVTISNAVFVSPAGETVRQSRPVILTTTVGMGIPIEG